MLWTLEFTRDQKEQKVQHLTKPHAQALASYLWNTLRIKCSWFAEGK